MIELSLDEWAEKLLVRKQYVTRSIHYDDGITIIMDTINGLFYAATYNKGTNKIELRETDEDAAA